MPESTIAQHPCKSAHTFARSVFSAESAYLAQGTHKAITRDTTLFKKHSRPLMQGRNVFPSAGWEPVR